MPIFTIGFEPKPKAVASGAIPMAIAVDAKSAKLAVMNAIVLMEEEFPDSSDNFLKPKVCADRVGLPRPPVGKFSTEWMKEVFWNEETKEFNTLPTETDEVPTGPIDLMQQPANVRIAAVVMYGDGEIDNSQLSLVVDMLNDEDTPDDTGMRGVIDALTSVTQVGCMYVKGNPCKGVRQYKEKARERYITDAEYTAVYAVADDTVRAVMELAYLCCARQSDVLALTRDQLLDTGIYICQGKTGAKQIKAWSDRLRAAVALADSVPMNGIASVYVIHQHNGNRYTRDGFNSKWRNAKLAAKAANPGMDVDFTFHDLKAKGISDLEGSLSEKQAISGHKNSSQTAIYDRKVKIVPVVGNQ